MTIVNPTKRAAQQAMHRANQSLENFECKVIYYNHTDCHWDGYSNAFLEMAFTTHEKVHYFCIYAY